MFGHHTSRRGLDSLTDQTYDLAWSITDETLTKIEEQIAVHAPERGGALVKVKGSRTIVDFLGDPRPGSETGFYHSDELRALLNDYEVARPARTYAGTLHSHPWGMGEPSSQDHRAFANTLRDNPELREVLFPIVVQTPSSELARGVGQGDRHLQELPSGTFSAFTAVRSRLGVSVRPVPVHVMPIRKMTRAAIDLLSAGSHSAISAGETLDYTLAGRTLPAISVRGAGTRIFLVFPESFPHAAPMFLGPDGTLIQPEWKSHEAVPEQLAEALKRSLGLIATDPPGAHVLQEVRREKKHTGLEDRLAHHLPEGVAGRYLVLGAGSVGSQAAEMLVRSGVKRLTVVDFDEVETANLSRTVYTSLDVGQKKVSALARRLKEIHPAVDIETLDCPIHELDEVLLTSADVAILATDDLGAEASAAHILYAAGVPAVSIKVFALGDASEVLIADPRRNTPCLRCSNPVRPTSVLGTTNYGTGRIDGALALGPDISAGVARGVKVALALGQESGPLAEWIAPLLADERVCLHQSNVADYQSLTLSRKHSLPFQVLWFRGPSESDRANCAVCGETRRSYAPVTMPEGLPPEASELPALITGESTA